MQIEVRIVNAFIDGPAGGNPAGVVVDANALTAAQKLKVARQVGLSETAFVSASDTASIKLEFFTPTRQIAHCGHATIATAEPEPWSMLAHQISRPWPTHSVVDSVSCSAWAELRMNLQSRHRAVSPDKVLGPTAELPLNWMVGRA